MRVTCAVIGGGIIGSSIAYELTRKGASDVHLLDPDLEGSLSSTERNAGGVRHLWQHRINMELSRHSIDLFREHATEVGFRPSGYLWLYSSETAAAGESLLKYTRAAGLEYHQYAVADLKQRYPFIDKTDDLAFAIYGARDGLLNSNAVKQFYRAQAQAKGATLHDRTVVKSMSESQTGQPILKVGRFPTTEEAQKFLTSPQNYDLSSIPEETWHCDYVIVCAGAWTLGLLKPLVKHPMIEPIRRQICMFKAEDFDLNEYGMIVDTSRVYFHPEAGNIIAGIVLKDEPPGFRFDLDADFFESHIWPALYERSSKLERLKLVTGWGGLYSYTPDTSGILGKIPGMKNSYEAHSFTGRGVMQSYGVATALTELILDGKFGTIDASCLGRDRFTGGAEKQLHEQLHI